MARNMKKGEHILKIQANGTHDVLVRGETLVDVVGVVDDIATEEKATDDGNNEVESTIEGKEDGNETRHYCRNNINTCQMDRVGK